MTNTANELARTAARYDSAPYPSHPYPLLQPVRLAAIAHLFGLRAPRAASARTLEIGCASAGHIIPLAAAFPEASFVGIDLSPVQIGAGLARIERLKLRNIELACCGVAELGVDRGRFDYILCHGVYSWVPQTVREAILEACRHLLAPEGIAVVSYNVLPGWRMLQVVRDCAILHAGGEATPGGRAGAVRQLLDLCKSHSRENSSYGRLWRNEAQRMRHVPDSYIEHELFEESNSPCTFTEFASAAAQHGLAYLGEANIASMIPETLGSEAAEIIRELSKGDILRAEQYIDMLSGWTFRHTLLVHESRGAAIDRFYDLNRLDGLHFVSAPGFRAVTSEKLGEFKFDDGMGTTMSTADVVVRDSIERFIARLPSSSSLDDLAPPDFADAQDRMKVAEAFVKMLALELVGVSTEPFVLPGVLADRPKAWFVAASDAAHGGKETATRRHERYTLNPLATVLLPLLDGMRVRDDIVAHVSALARDGRIVVRDADGKPLADAGRVSEAAGRMIDGWLATAVRNGLLE
jgi:SAM-dependent methyltransferase